MICRGTPPMGGWLGVSVGQWVGQVKSLLIDLDIIEIIQFCLKIIICGDTSTYWWVYGWFLGGSVGQWVGSGHITKYRINLDLIKIINSV